MGATGPYVNGMANILRVKLRWTGLPGGNGYSIFHFKDFAAGEPAVGDADGAKGKVNTFVETIKGYIPPSVSMQVESEVEVLDESNGQLQNVLGGSVPQLWTGGGSDTLGWSAPTGAVVSWSTGGIRNGRRIRGRTFIVPLAGNAYENNGTLSGGFQMVVNMAATALRADSGTPDLGIWARPTATGASDGVWNVVTGHRNPDMAAILRSRRS